jgi:phenylpyruvate tautomerase PptA (4-oxalocrotonate tautomerase family)
MLIMSNMRLPHAVVHPYPFFVAGKVDTTKPAPRSIRENDNDPVATRVTDVHPSAGGARLVPRLSAAEARRLVAPLSASANGEVSQTEGEQEMPLVRIDLNKDAPSERVRVVSQAVYGAMTDIANVPVNDKFQIVTPHSADEIIYPDEGFLGIQYSPDLIFIQVTWVAGRSTDVKKQFYRRIADEVHERAGVRKEDIFISLVDSGREDWSFGNGDMQNAPK